MRSEESSSVDGETWGKIDLVTVPLAVESAHRSVWDTASLVILMIQAMAPLALGSHVYMECGGYLDGPGH